MGDRANVIFKHNEEQVCLYTHWHGEELPNIVREALSRGKGRWSDFQYLTRIVFCEMIKGDVLGDTGFVITQDEHDGGRTVFIDCNSATVRLDEGGEISFSDFVANKHVWQ